MKNIKILTLITLLLTTITSIAQTYKGSIVEGNNLPLAGVSIISTENNERGTTTDLDGNFEIKLENPKVIVSYMGFKTQKIVLKSGINKIVLQEDTENLEEVIISASREKQQRKFVPAAIGIMSSKDIEETKAFGIEQIVNQVPGVYMSASSAAGNEQHMMAIRTPISTKGLFLYLEDGLPIRPVAVFNHNALLEMNSTSFGSVEILKGPASSIYGSEAIGGSINFITKKPSKDLTGSIVIEANTLSLQKIGAEVSTTFKDKYGFYFGAHKVRRKNGFIEHSDYDKFAITFKNVNDFSEKLRLTNAVTYVDFETDMGSSSLTEKNYLAGEYKSNHTFANRTAKALRARSTLDFKWNETNKTSFNFIYRNNEMGQIPSYRIKEKKIKDPVTGKTIGTGKYFGTVNSNSFQSYVGLIQHKIDFNFAKSSLIIGGVLDYSPQEYWAKTTSVTYDKTTEKYTNYDFTGLYRMFYGADILNYAGYAQFEISPIENLKFTGAIRYDGFGYDYDNNDEGKSGVKDQRVTFTNLSPKLGLNYNLTNSIGMYTNYSRGFQPPGISALFGNKGINGEDVYKLKSSHFDSYEFGAYAMLGSILKLDFALYRLDGKNRTVTTYDEIVGKYIPQSAGQTRSQGVEFGVNWKITEKLTFDYSGSHATHKYIKFDETATNYKTKKKYVISHDNTAMQVAPFLINTMSLKYKPLENLLVTVQHEQVGNYNTSYENGAKINGKKVTATYDGHNLLNMKVDYTYRNFNVWMQGLNLFDKLYSTRASYSWGSNRYSIGGPRAFHFGVKYNL